MKKMKKNKILPWYKITPERKSAMRIMQMIRVDNADCDKNHTIDALKSILGDEYIKGYADLIKHQDEEDAYFKILIDVWFITRGCASRDPDRHLKRRASDKEDNKRRAKRLKKSFPSRSIEQRIVARINAPLTRILNRYHAMKDS